MRSGKLRMSALASLAPMLNEQTEKREFDSPSRCLMPATTAFMSDSVKSSASFQTDCPCQKKSMAITVNRWASASSK